MSESILNTLRAEHRETDELMVLIEGTDDVSYKKELYLQLKENLMAHMEGEEKTLYAHLIQDVHDEEAEEVALQAEDEHAEVKDLFYKLDNIGIESDDWDSTFRELRDHVRQHVEEEESSLFAEAKEDFSREELVEFGDEFAEAKQHPHL